MTVASPHGHLWSAWRYVRRLVPRPVLASFVLPVSRVTPARLGLGTLLGLAVDFEAVGDYRWALRCWRALHRMVPADARLLVSRFRCAMETGDRAELARLVDDPGVGSDISPRQTAWLAGQLASAGHWLEAQTMVRRLEAMPNAGKILLQSPSIVSRGLPTDLGELARGIEVPGSDFGRWLLLARLCFTLRNPDVAVTLYRKAMCDRSLTWWDRVAMLAAWAQSDTPGMDVSSEELASLLRQAAEDVDALGMLAHTAMHLGDQAVARAAIAQALQKCDWIAGGDSGRVVADCLDIVGMIASLRSRCVGLPPEVLEEVPDPAPGIPKVFLCGFGWSGSGALYDEIRAVPGFCEFEGAGDDAIVNEGAESEVTFIQSAGGLGRLWISARQDRCISWQGFWDLFSYHVAGLSPVGYDRYKSCSAARNNLLRYGTEYVRPFRALIEGYLEMREAPRAGALHCLFLDVTESLCAMLAERTGSEAVLFNNAIFGRNAEMLDIFRSYLAAIVYRDPRDVYVDRRKNDRNHWRSARELAAFYARGLRDYCTYRSGRTTDARLREVPFERFVKDPDYRARVREWLCSPLQSTAGASHFDPRLSERNIGLHAGVLARDEVGHLAFALSGHREIERLSEASWRDHQPR